MNSSPVDVERFLPFGEMLRTFVQQPFLSKADLSKLLRDRGVFINPDQKENTIPWLTSLLLSPDEFDRLREAQSSREDNQKTITQLIDWATGQFRSGQCNRC
jgi:hypothetical protein